MKPPPTEARREPIWSVQDAKAKLSEVLRRAREEGPQVIGTVRPCVVVPEELWREKVSSQEPLGRWLVAHAPRGEALSLPDRTDPPRPSPFSSDP